MLLSFLKKISIYDRPSRPPRHVASVTWDLALGTRPSKSPSFGTRGAVLAPVFVRQKKIILVKRRGKSIKQKLWKWYKLLFCFILMIFFGLSKTEKGTKNRSSGAITKFPGDTRNVVCYMYTYSQFHKSQQFFSLAYTGKDKEL